jgi:hypothetical protein
MLHIHSGVKLNAFIPIVCLDDLGESSSNNQACQMQTARETIAESKNQNKV